ncbi:hypothetical protein MP228_010141 [Amoeboaphelidium protococcarum]|nr:hypothetical protein MP228_010141 [Amoeboaphelidium protococcarum]
MNQFTPVNPKPFLSDLVNDRVQVKLKWGMLYEGQLKSFDSYMNIRLAECDEYFLDNTKSTQQQQQQQQQEESNNKEGSAVEWISNGHLGDVLIRCNNVLWIRKASSIKDLAASGADMEQDQEEEDVDAEDNQVDE